MCRRSLQLLLAAALAVQGLAAALPHRHEAECVVLASGHVRAGEDAGALLPVLAVHAQAPCLACALGAPVAAVPRAVDAARRDEPGERLADRPAPRSRALADHPAASRGPPSPG